MKKASSKNHEKLVLLLLQMQKEMTYLLGTKSVTYMKEILPYTKKYF